MSSVILRKWKTKRPTSSYTCVWAAALETHKGLPFARGKAGHKRSFRSMQLPLSRIIWCLRYEAASFGPTETFPFQRCVGYWKMTRFTNALFVISLRITFDEICYRRLNCRLKVLDICRFAISHQSHQSPELASMRSTPTSCVFSPSNSLIYKACEEISRSVLLSGTIRQL